LLDANVWLAGGELFLHLQRQPKRRFTFPVAAFYIAEVVFEIVAFITAFL
jgi:hypothetical protein